MSAVAVAKRVVILCGWFVTWSIPWIPVQTAAGNEPIDDTAATSAERLVADALRAEITGDAGDVPSYSERPSARRQTMRRRGGTVARCARAASGCRSTRPSKQPRPIQNERSICAFAQLAATRSAANSPSRAGAARAGSTTRPAFIGPVCSRTIRTTTKRSMRWVFAGFTVG